MLERIARQQEEIAELETENAELKRDKARLDFIQRYKIELMDVNGRWAHYGLGFVRRNEHRYVRDAIDDAMKERNEPR